MKYNGVVMSLADFARLVDVDYHQLRARARMGKNVFAPMQKAEKVRTYTPRKTDTVSGGYSMDELAELYGRFRGTEEELDVLADFACVPRHSAAVKNLREEIQKYIQKKYREVRQ